MSGIYIHIPFCKQACHYCDFHFSTQTGYRERMLQAMGEELKQRREYLPDGTRIQTIYFGGGTPSLLPPGEIETLLNIISSHYPLALQEVTLEANPDDLSKEKLLAYQSMGVDRLSIGIQSFQEPLLRYYNRAHTAAESHRVLDYARDAGFQKLSIDLMYGFPAPDHEYWLSDLEMALQKDPGHISSYSLTVEADTALGRWTKAGKFLPAEEEFVAEQFEMLQEAMEAKGYIQYEISNFGREGQFAVHNTNYWKGVPYLGIGPSAHSFDGTNRGHNIPNNALYLKGMASQGQLFEIDVLNQEDRANEYLLTALRTIWGVDLGYFEKTYGLDLRTVRSAEIHLLQQHGWLSESGDSLTLTKAGKLLADSIAAKLFL
ncbi:MAG: radical SAM family heme chaperone HemW [Lunatimonas sp.]|uniref:radical SAM family heme chaperone HemW n=1 Tax=Lunatimonas sp. TaxID=2060141 RepID=UPI00263B680E|nr:radical SAM family heme chaperone HemW [Lunatimonas sp.]MCC5937748.1 radical SAM family heme chaperone HemW [Lunatimonas sp.]